MKRKVGAILVIVGMQLLIFGVICSQWVYIRIGLGNQYILGRSLLSTEYSCAATPQIRQTGNRLSGLAETAYASLLAQCFV